MNNRLNRHFLKSLTVALFLALSLPALALSQNSKNASTQTTESEMEVIEVTSERHLYSLRKEIAKRREAYYMMLNEIIDDEEFHFTCGRDRKTGFMRVEQRGCKPQYQNTIMEKMIEQRLAGRRVLDSGAIISLATLNRTEFKRRVAKKDDEMAKLIEDALQESEDLVVTYNQYLNVKAQFRAAHLKKWGKWSKYYYQELEGLVAE